MNYLDNNNAKNEILIGDIIFTHKYKGAKEQMAIVTNTDDKNQLVCAKIIENGEEVYTKPFKMMFIKHTTNSEEKHYHELIDKLIKNKKEKYTNIDYIKDNISNRDVINNISIKFLAERAKIDRTDIDYWQYLYEGIVLACIYDDFLMYKFVIKTCTDYDDSELDDLMSIHNLLN